MARLKIRHFTERTGLKGGVRYFWQPAKALRDAGWKLSRLPDNRQAAIAEAERLNAEVDAWRKGAKPALPLEVRPMPGTLNALITRYKQSDDYKTLDPQTRRNYLRDLNRLAEWSGDVPAIAITPKLAADWVKSLQRKTIIVHGKKKVVTAIASAAAAARVARLLYNFGRREDFFIGVPGWANPFEEMKLRSTPLSWDDTEEEKEDWDPEEDLWLADDVRNFATIADRMGYYSMGTAVILNEWLGQRRKDVIRFSSKIYRNGAFYVRQKKRGARVILPVDDVPHIKARIADEIERLRKREIEASSLLVSEMNKRPYTDAHFRTIFDLVRAEAAKEYPRLAKLKFMRLRHTALVRLFEAGTELGEAISITGHSPRTATEIIKHYLVRTRKLAVNAFRRRLIEEADSLGIDIVGQKSNVKLESLNSFRFVPKTKALK